MFTIDEGSSLHQSAEFHLHATESSRSLYRECAPHIGSHQHKHQASESTARHHLPHLEITGALPETAQNIPTEHETLAQAAPHRHAYSTVESWNATHQDRQFLSHRATTSTERHSTGSAEHSTTASAERHAAHRSPPAKIELKAEVPKRDQVPAPEHQVGSMSFKSSEFSSVHDLLKGSDLSQGSDLTNRGDLTNRSDFPKDGNSSKSWNEELKGSSDSGSKIEFDESAKARFYRGISDLLSDDYDATAL